MLDICNFSKEIVGLLVDEATAALQFSDYAGLDFAAYLLQEARKYDALNYHARGGDKELFEATQKLYNWQTD